MFKWIKKIKESKLTADVARENNRKHLDELKQQQQDYKLELCNEIRWRSLRGYKCVDTHNVGGYWSFITREYLENDLKSYFESKGFTTKFVDYGDGGEDGYLRISWGEE